LNKHITEENMEKPTELAPPVFEVKTYREPDGSYWVEAPGIPGLVTQGNTKQELVENLQEAFNGWMLATDPETAAKLGIVATPPLLDLAEDETIKLTVGGNGRLRVAV